MPKFGPGTLTIGATGTEVDCSCLVNSFTISADKTEADSRTMLCGTVKPGAVTYKYKAAGNLDIDTEDPSGIFFLSQSAPASEQAFLYTPSTEDGTSASGTLILDPMAFGSDTYGADLASDVEWTVVGAPVYTPGAGAAASRFDRSVTNGTGADPAAPSSTSPRRGRKAASV